jgi:hypothetical protein
VKAIEQEKESYAICEELDKLLDDDTRQQWIELEQLAVQFRGDHLKIYEVNLPSGKHCVNGFL